MKANGNYKVAVIASGSSGNCSYIEAGGARILVDAGVSCKRIVTGLESIGVLPESIDAIFLTHEHTDHIAGLEVFQKKYHKDLYATTGTIGMADRGGKISSHCAIKIISQFSENAINGACVSTFMTDHDAAEPCGVTVDAGGFKISLATDLGYVNRAVAEHLKDSNILIFESNYDEKMLINGTYPWDLKKRIMSKKGHLSNKDSSNAILELNWEGLLHVYIAHISRENNTHQIAHENLKTALSGESRAPNLILTWRDRVSECVDGRI